MSTPKYALQVILSSGPQDVEKVVLGLASAVSCASSGDDVVVFLTMHGAAWAAEEVAIPRQPIGFQPPLEYMRLLVELGARVEACTSCVENYCDAPRDESGERKLAEGIVRAGLSTAAIRMTSTPTVVF